MAKDLERWHTDSSAPAELQALLRAARDDLPTAKQLGGLEARLGSLLDEPPPQPAPPVDAAAGQGLPIAAKLAVLVAVGGLVGFGIYQGLRRSSAPTTSGTSAPVPALTRPAAQEPRAPAPTASAPLDPAPLDPAPLDPAPTNPAATEPSPAERGTTESPAAPSEPRATPPPVRTAKPSEASLLDQARRALKTDPKRALALTRHHQRLYPAGTLAQEREVIAIEALARLKDQGGARERATEFSEKYPESAHQKKVDTTLDE